MDILALCGVLCGRGADTSTNPGDELVSSSLMSVFQRVNAAEQLGSCHSDVMAMSCLVRTALLEHEDDRVRVACVQQIVRSRWAGGEAVLLSLLCDCDDELVKAAFEGLVLIGSEVLDKYVDYFRLFPNDIVRKYMSYYTSNRDVPLYKLDP